MCGIVVSLGPARAYDRLIAALKALEYRGYDSAGIVTLEEGNLRVLKREGKIKKLEEVLAGGQHMGTVGIGHTRWATHGAPSDLNAHPHLSGSGRIALVHNGIVENFRELRAELGCDIESDTDTAVLPYLIERELQDNGGTLETAVFHALTRVKGTYALAVMSADYPDEVVVASESSPLVVGIGEGEFLVASDEIALGKLGFSHSLHLRDGEIATLRRGEKLPLFRQQSSHECRSRIEKVKVVPADVSLGIHRHHMVKEIKEQPQKLRETLRGRLNIENHTVRFGFLDDKANVERLRFAKRLIMSGCGTSLNAEVEGKLLIEALARVPVEVEHASEFRYRDPILDARDVAFFASQSGQTMDTLKALRLAKARGAACFSIVNVVGSAIAREAGAGVYLHVGPEQAVASTKAFVSTVAVFALLAMKLAELRGTLDKSRVERIMDGLDSMPELLNQVLAKEGQIMEIAKKYARASRAVCLGRGFGLPLALEGALKLKEIAYLDTHGYPTGELKHGPLALIENGVPVIVLARSDPLLKKNLSNMEEVRTRGGEVIAITTAGDHSAHATAKEVIELPDAPEELIAILAAPVYQLLAYHLGKERGNDVDQPRNLAKSVTVE